MPSILPPIEGPTLIIVLGAVVVFTLFALIGIIAAVLLRPRMRLQKRMAMIGALDMKGSSGKAEGRRQKRIQEKVQQLKDAKKNQGGLDKIRIDLLRAGLNTDVRTYIIACVVVGIVAALAYLLTPFHPLGAIGVGPAVGFGLPKLVLNFLAGGRQKQFTQHFAEATDVIVRGIRSGLPVSECMNIIGREFPGPVGEEFRMIVEGQNLGFSLDEIMRRGLERMPTSEFKFFAIVLQIQKQTGGNLADTLENLSNVLRDRKKMKDKVRALSSEAKSSAGIIAALPFFVMGMLSLVNPDYLMLLFTEDVGHYLLGGGLTWGMIGIAVMYKMINFKI